MKKQCCAGLMAIIMLFMSGCSDTKDPYTNTITESPPMYEVTLELDKRLVGRYQGIGTEHDEEMYFEIRPDGTVEIKLNYLEGYTTYTSKDLFVTAYYREENNGMSDVFGEITDVYLTFHLKGGKSRFPLGTGMGLNFTNDYINRQEEPFKVFYPMITKNNELNVPFEKVK